MILCFQGGFWRLRPQISMSVKVSKFNDPAVNVTRVLPCPLLGEIVRREKPPSTVQRQSAGSVTTVKLTTPPVFGTRVSRGVVT